MESLRGAVPADTSCGSSTLTPAGPPPGTRRSPPPRGRLAPAAAPLRPGGRDRFVRRGRGGGCEWRLVNGAASGPPPGRAVLEAGGMVGAAPLVFILSVTGNNKRKSKRLSPSP